MSNRVNLLAVLAAFTAAGLVTWGSATANFALQAPTAAVAVADIQKIFNACKEYQEIQADIGSDREQVKADLESRTKEIQQLQADLQLLDPQEAAFKQKEQVIERKFIEQKVTKEFRERQLGRELMLQFEGLYRKMREASAHVARVNGYNIVLYKESPELSRPQNFNLAQMLSQIGGRKVLWATEELDVTDQVLQHMNNEWDARHQ